MEKSLLTISKVALQCGISTDTMRYYEKEGLIAPAGRTPSGYRLYTDDALRRLAFIKHAQQCGFMLPEIKELLDLKFREHSCCNDVRAVALQKYHQLQRKVEALQSMSLALENMIISCSDNELPVDECPILKALETSIHRGNPVSAA